MSHSFLEISQILTDVRNALKSSILGQDELIDKLLITIFASGHALLEWTPWLGKTHAIKRLSEVFSLQNNRISFTPDLIPSDVIGAEIFRIGKWEFEIRKWPIFTNFLLADEINRTPPKVQSALLEAMEEKHVTIAGTNFSLPEPFFVFATQNPLENEGTFPLPEAQLDRFLLKISLRHPDPFFEKNILSENFEKTIKTPILNGADIITIQNFIQKNITVSEEILDYIVRILDTYRQLEKQDTLFGTENSLLDYGPSTRAGIALVKTSRVFALLQGREYVLPDDIKMLIPSVIHHRIGLSYHSLSEQIDKKIITEKILDTVNILAK